MSISRSQTISQFTADVHKLECQLTRQFLLAATLLVDGVDPQSPTMLEAHFSESLPGVLPGDCRSIVNLLIENTSNDKNRLTAINELLGATISKVHSLFRGVFDVLYVHFDRVPDLKMITSTYGKWMVLALQDRLEDWYKFQSCYILSLVTKQDINIQEMPERPSWLTDKPGYLFGGWFYRYVRTCICKPLTQETLCQFYALTNVKRAGLAISEKKQRASLVKHVKNMNGAEYKPRPAVVPFYPNKGPLLQVEVHPVEDVLDRVKYRLECLLNDGFKRKQLNFKWRVPSVNACYENKAVDGGSHFLFDFKGYFRSVNPEFIGYAHYRTQVVPVYVPYIPEEMYSEALSSYRSEYLTGLPPKATVHKVLEPFKCRIITAGNALPYHLGRIIQKPIHTVMRNHRDMFHLTGAPVTLEFINKVYKDTLLLPEKTGESDGFDPLRDRYYNSMFCAGDYQSATDGMHPDLNVRFTEYLALLTNMPKTLRHAMLKCLEGHVLEYDFDLSSEGLEKYQIPKSLQDMLSIDDERAKRMTKQNWGQLMGSPVSFFILCYVNAAINWAACDLYHRREIPINQWLFLYKPIFNGDDTSFLTNSEHYKVWQSVASCCGLNVSLGKSYCHKNFIMINSEIFWVDLEDSGFVKEIKDCFVLNPGLVKGQAKVLGDTRSSNSKLSDVPAFSFKNDSSKMQEKKFKKQRDIYAELLPMVDQLNSCLRKSLPEQQDKVTDLFYDHVLPRLKGCNRPWALPRWAGGLGLKGLGHVTYSQRKLLAWYLMTWDFSLTSYSKEIPLCSVVSNRDLCEVYDRLGVEKTLPELRLPTDVLMEPEECEEISLDKFYVGASRVEHGQDRYATLLKDVLKHPWVTPVSDQYLNEIWDLEFIPPQVRGKVHF